MAAAEAVRVLRATPGRIRVHMPSWDGNDPAALEDSLEAIDGVLEASARPSTQNALVCFDERHTDNERLLAAISKWSSGPRMRGPRVARTRATPKNLTGVIREQAGRFGRARIGIPGIERDPQLAQRVVETLERRHEVKRAAVSLTTGRVMVEFSERVSSLQDLLADVSKVGLPDLPGEDCPEHPLDPTPILQSGARVAGSALGLTLLMVRRALGSPDAPVAPTAPAVAAGVLGIADGAPPVRNRLREALGKDRSELLLGGAAIASLTLSGSPLGLMVAGLGALRLFTEGRLRRAAWQEYEQRVERANGAQPGAVVKLEAQERVPLRARVIEGVGTVVGADGLPDGVCPGAELSAGARLLHGPLVCELIGEHGFAPLERPAPPRPDALAGYLTLLGPASVAYAVAHALRARSPAALFTGLLLVNARPALIGSEAADTGANARILRAGATVVGTRPERHIRRPDVLIIDGPRVLSRGLEQTAVVAAKGEDRAHLEEVVSAMLAAAGAPWGSGLPVGHSRRAERAEFDGDGITATIEGKRLRLEPADADDEENPEVAAAIDAGEQPLVLRPLADGSSLAFVRLRPRLEQGVEALRECCRADGVEVLVLEREDRRASRNLTRRAGFKLVLEADLVELVRERQRRGDRVAVLSDTPQAAEAFEACDLAIGLSSGRSSHFQARADLLAPGLAAVASIVEAGARREQAAAISIGCSVLANAAGALWGLSGEPGLARASNATYLGALGALVGGWQRLRGGGAARSVIDRLTDPRPERWGMLDTDEVLESVGSRPEGLTGEEAASRGREDVQTRRENPFVASVKGQLSSPLVAVLGTGAALSMAIGATADVVIIAAVIAANAGVGAWQERQAGKAAAALERLGAAQARVLREDRLHELPAEQVVVGDVLVVQAGDRIVADARLLESDALEVDEAALTGESLPVAKSPDAEAPDARIVMEGSDVTVGSGQAVVVAAGADTRLGATAAALSYQEKPESPLSRRLDRLFRQGMPVVVAGGALVTIAGIAWGGAPLTQLAVGASVAVAAVPEGLPLLAGVSQAAVARRLARRSALVRRLSAVESLGRVEVACCDKTGTLTSGKLAVTLLDDLDQEARLPGKPAGELAEVLLASALASPRPDSPDALAHPTDGAVLRAGIEAGFEERLLGERTAESPFDPARPLHTTALPERVCIKGAAEEVVPRCAERALAGGGAEPLDDSGRRALLRRAESLAERGLRVLMVAQGPPDAGVENPRGLRALGFIGISDPLREGVAAAVERCSHAGIRVVMLTGDHPATARAIAQDAGLPLGPGAILTGDELTVADDAALAERLERATVVARITPVDKVRIVESLKRRGHVVAMTGDGVNDAPALRLADVGVAMGSGGTEVARQAADLVLADDRFETLTDALLEGRSLWQNLREALALLLGGNLGEIGLMAGAALFGRGAVLGARQILTVNLVTDVLPAVAVAVQPPRERELRHVEREGQEVFDDELARDVVRRGIATSVPSLAAVLVAPLLGAQATGVAFASIIFTQLAQTVQAGRAQSRLSPPVLGAIAGSGAVVAMSYLVGPLRRFLGLPALTARSAALIAASAPAAPLLASGLERMGR